MIKKNCEMGRVYSSHRRDVKYKVLVDNPEGNRWIRRPRRSYKGNIKIYVKWIEQYFLNFPFRRISCRYWQSSLVKRSYVHFVSTGISWAVIYSSRPSRNFLSSWATLRVGCSEGHCYPEGTYSEAWVTNVTLDCTSTRMAEHDWVKLDFCYMLP
jgi:hypothetical protein